MASVSEIKKRIKNNGISGDVGKASGDYRLDNNTTTSKDEEGYVGTSRYQWIKERVRSGGISFESLGVNQDYVNSFISDANTFLSTAEDDYRYVGWDSASSAYNQRKSRYSDLYQKSSIIRTWLNANKGQLDEETYNSLYSALDNFGTSASSVVDAFKSASDYYSQWETEEDYSAYVKSAEDYNAKKDLDLDSAWAEIEELTFKRDEYNSLQSELKQILDAELPRLQASYSKKYGASWQTKAIEDIAKLNPRVAEIKEALEGYGEFSLDDTEEAITSKTQYYNQAKQIQDVLGYSAVPDAEDYDQFSQAGANVANPTWDDASAPVVIGGWKPFGDGDEVINMVTFAEENSDKALADSAKALNGGGGSEYAELVNLINNFMYPEEKGIYNYYIGKGETEKADEYLTYMTDVLRQRQAGKMVEQADGKALELAFSMVAGLDQWASGVKNLDNYWNGTEADPTSSVQYAQSAMSSNNTGLWKVSNDLINTAANQLPSILTSTLSNAIVPGSGQIVGSVVLGSSAMGNAYAEMRNLGFSGEQARNYATLVGASEAGLSYLLGGISALGGKVSGNIISKAISKIDNTFARVAIQLGGSMLSEGFEEGLQTALEPWFKSLATGVDFEAADIDEILYSGLLGALSAGLLEGGGTVAGTVNTYGQGKNLMEQGVTAKSLSEYVANNESLFSADTVAYRLAGKVNEKTGAYTIARLFNEVNATLTEANQNDIIRSLERKGVATKDAKTIATTLASVVAGAELTDTQKAALDSNPDIAKTMVDVIVNPNSTVNQRMKGFNEAMVGERVAKEYTEKISTSTTLAESTAEAESKAEEIEPIDSGKTIYKDKEVSIKRIVSTVGGIKVELDDGETVNATDLSHSSKEEALMYEMVARMETTPETANEIINAFKPSDLRQATMYFASVPLAYNYGKIGYEAGLKNTLLTDAERKLVYNRGRHDAMIKANTKSTTSKKVGSSKPKDGIIYEDGFTYDESSASEIQKVSMAYIEAINKMSNLEVHVFESKVENGKRVAYVNGKLVDAPNGYYQNGNQIYIDINAGNDAEGVMLHTMAHEISHYIRKWNAKGFKELGDFLMEQYGKKGVPVHALLEAQKEKIEGRYKEEGKTLPSEAKLADMAYEELVADAMSEMLTDPKAYEKLAKLKQKNRTLWQKVGEAIKAILDKFKTALGIYKGKDVSTEAFAVRDFAPDVYEKLQDLYIKAFVEADNNYSSAEQTLAESGIAVNPDTDSASILSVRDVLDEDQRNKAALALAKRFDVTKEEAMDWLKAETSMASLILNPKYSQYLDYTPDPNEVAIKQNSDYPQGTVDFSPICAKRREFTSVMNNILRLFPNHVFAATDLAKIRSIMQEEGMTIPCGICYVEDRRQLDTIVAQNFIDSLNLYREGSKTRPDGKPFNANQLKGLSLIDGDSYTPSVYELVSLEGLNVLKEKNPNMAEAWVKFNNARGMQSVRLLANEAEYKRQILKYTKKTVQSKNDHGGLRVYSFSDAEMFHLIDIIQVITDSATVGLSLQGYTKVNEYAKAVKDTGEKLNRSLIPKGELGYHIEDGKVVLDYDTVEGIDINHPDFFDNKDNPNVGNITIGVSDVQIRAAMVSDFVDQIIPFHTGQSEEVLGEKGIATWTNYKDFQTEKDIATGKVSDHQINIYTEVLQVLEKEGKPINKRTFVEKFLQVCKDNGLTPRFSQFLNTNENGEYVYTEGYHKMLVDFKTFAQTEVGEYLPQMPVKPIFDNEYITKILKDYVKSQKVKDAGLAESMPKVIERITNEIVKPSEVKFSSRDSLGNELSAEQQEFFKDSKVRDQKGNLMVLYHGTTANFNTFKKGDVGFHFGTKGAARGRVGFGKNVTLKEVYLNITNPIVFDEDLGSWDADFRLTRELYDRGILTREDAESVLFTDNKLYKRTTEAADKKLASVLLEKGYDGIAYTNTFESKKATTSYIVFNSNQAKEITNKAPTSDPDIRYALRGKNKHGIEVYETSEEIKKLPIKERQKAFLDIMKNEYRGRTAKFIRNGHAYYASFDYRDINKNIYGDKLSDKKGWKAKINVGAEGEIFELVENSKYNGSKAESGKNIAAHSGVGYWDYFVKTVQIDNTVFDLIANVRKKSDGQFVYSIQLNENKKIEASPSLGSPNGVLNRMLNASANMIAQDSDSVKREFSETEVKTSLRGKGTVSNRTLLANALESVAENDIEKNKLAQYKNKIALIESEQAKLNEIRAKAQELRFTKGRTPSETKTMRDLDFEANQIANRISTYDKQLLNLESTTALKNVLEREKVKLRKKLEQKSKEALRKQKEKDAETVRELMNRHTESRQKAIEGRYKTEMRHKIKKVVSDLNKLLLNPTKEQHVPIGLQGVVAEALDAINMDTMNAEERVAYYNALISKSSDPDEIKMLTRKRDFFEYRDANFKERITALKNAYAEFKESDDPLIRNAHNDAIEDLIKNTADAVGNKSLKDMSYAQLESVYDMYKAILATVRNSNKMFKENIQATVTENSESVKVQVKEAGGHKDRVLKVFKFIKKFGWNMLKPITAMKVIGSNTFAKLFDNVRAGEDVWAVDVNEAKEFYKAVSDRYGYNKWDFKTQHNFKDSRGEEFSISLEQMMSLYAYSKRDQADKHLEFGGFIFDDAIEVTEKKLGIPLKYEVNDANPHRLGQIQIMEIIGELTQEQKGFIDEMQAYLSDVMGAKGNEVSLALYDIKLYKEKNYFPLKTARYFREFDPEKSATPKVKNAGFSKKTVPQAGNPIVLSNFMDVWASHVNDMSMYHAFVLPLEDFMRVYNYSSTAGGYDSVQQYIKNAYGAEANQYIERLMDDLNGGARVDSSAGIINKGLSLFKRASVFASASVVVQQPSAIARAFAYINPKYFATSTGSALNLVKHKTVWAEVKKYAPVAIIKDMGYFDTGMGRSTVEWIKGNKTIKDKVDDALSKAPAMADELSWSYIWLAVKNEIKATTNLKVGSEEFLKRCGERFTEIITNTQVYDSVLSRSGMMRSKDTGMKMATAFMAEPTTTVNMMVDGIIQGKRGNKKFTASTVGAVSASIILNSLLVSLVYAARDDDEDETYAEKYIGSLTTELLDGFNPLTYIPFVKDIWSIAQGYDVERSDMSVVSDLWETIEGLFNEDKSGWEKVADASGAVASLFGFPLKNILRDAKGMYNLFETVTSDTPTTNAGIGDAIGDAFKSSIPLWDRLVESDSKSDKLYDAILSGDENQIDRIKGQYEDEDAIESAMKKALRENDPRIKEAAQANLDGDIAKYTRIFNEILGEGNFDLDIIKDAIEAEYRELTKDDEVDEGKGSDDVESMFDPEQYYVALRKGDTVTANKVKQDIIQTAMANGKSRDEAEKSFNSSFRRYCKEGYSDGSLTRDEAMNMLVRYGGVESDDAYWTMKEWDYYKANGTDDGYSKYNDFYEAVKTGRNLKSVIAEYTDHGVETTTLASQITKYYKPLYIQMSNSERASIKGYLLNAYALLGYNRIQKSKDIDKWLES